MTPSRDNSTRQNISCTPLFADNLSKTELWVLSILKSHGFASLSWLSHLYHKAKDQTISPDTARHHLYRVLHHLASLGLVELQFDDHHLLTAKLKCVPLFYRSSSDGDERKFDLSHASRGSANLGFFASGVKKIQVKPSDLKDLRIKVWKFAGHSSKYRSLRVVHADSLKSLRGLVRVQRRLSEERREALFEIAGMTSLVPKSGLHYDLDFLFDQYERRLKESVVVLYDPESERYLTLPARSRFVDIRTLKAQYDRAERGLKRAFKKYHNAVFLTLTLPPVIPEVLVLPEFNAFLLLQDSALSFIMRSLKDLLRHHWRDRDFLTFTANEYHGDGRLHTHSLIFNLEHLLDWNKPVGRRKEPALLYYAKKYGIKVTRNLRKRPQRLAKFVLTKILDNSLMRFLSRVDSILGTHFLQAYLSYKEAKGIDGPVNEVHRIKDGKWHGSKPKDAHGPNAVKYVLKYLLKAIRELQLRALGMSRGLMSLKLLGYWLFSKRFYSHSPRLLGPPRKKDKEARYYYIGTFRLTDVPDYVYMPR